MAKLKHYLSILSFITFYSCVSELELAETNSFCIASYNTENLFDTINHPTTFDDEFTPTGKMYYDSYRYDKKIEHIAEVINDINTTAPIALIGLNEVENKLVLTDLVKRLNKPLAILHKNSADPRGIDNALLYNTIYFTPIHTKYIDIPTLNTRSILYSKGVLQSDTVHVFVNHWTSRVGGKEESEYKRLIASSILQLHIDSILSTNAKANLVLLGDFNDEIENKSLSALIENRPLINYVKNNDTASYKYKEKWTMLDHIICSTQLSNTYTINGIVFIKNYLLEADKKYGTKKPYRAYNGSQYIDGYSDHLPIYIILEPKNK